MSKIAYNLPRKFISFRHLGFKSSSEIFSEEREAENPQNVAQIDGVNTVVVGETMNSPAKFMSTLQSEPVGAEIVGVKIGNEDRDLTMAQKKCVLTSTEEEVEYLSFFFF